MKKYRIAALLLAALTLVAAFAGCAAGGGTTDTPSVESLTALEGSTFADGSASAGEETTSEEQVETDPLHPFKFDIAEFVEVPDVSSWTLDAAQLEERTNEALADVLSGVEVLEEKSGDQTVEDGDKTEIYYKGTLIVYDGEYAFTVGQSGIPGLDEALGSAEVADGKASVTLTLPEEFALPEIMKRENGLLDGELAGKEVTLVLSAFGDALPAQGGAFEGRLRFEYVFPGGTYNEESNGGNGYPLTIGSHSFITGFEEGMIGMSVEKGTRRVVPVAFPNPYRNNPALSGEPAEFEVTIVSVKRAHEFDLDDPAEFARFKEAYESENGEGSLVYKDKKELIDSCRDSARSEMIVELIDGKANMKKVPEDAYAEYKDTVKKQYILQISSYYSSMLGRALTEEEIVRYFFSGDPAIFEERIAENAKIMLARHLTVFLVAAEKGLDTLTEEDIDAHLNELSEMYSTASRKIETSEILSVLYDGKRSEVVKEIITNKTIGYLKENVPAV